MSANSTFHTLIEHLFKQFGITNLDHHKQDSYRLTLGKTMEIHLIGDQPGYFNMACIIGEVSDQTPWNTMKTLLRASHFSINEPFFQISLDQQTDWLILATRESLSQLDPVSLYNLVTLFINKAVELETLLEELPNKPKSGTPPPMPSLPLQLHRKDN